MSLRLSIRETTAVPSSSRSVERILAVPDKLRLPKMLAFSLLGGPAIVMILIVPEKPQYSILDEQENSSYLVLDIS